MTILLVKLFWLISLFSVSGKVQKLRAHTKKQTKATQKNAVPAFHAHTYTRNPQSMNVHSSILCIRGLLKQARRKGCWQTGVFSTPPSNPRFFSARQSMRLLKSRQSPRSVVPFPCFSGSDNGFDCFLAAADIISSRRRRCAALYFRCKLALLAGDGKGDIATKLLQHWHAMRPGNASLPLSPFSFATATLRMPLCSAFSGIANEKVELARSSAGLLLSLTNSSIIPQNVVRASSTRTSGHLWVRRSGNALYMYRYFKVCVSFFSWNPWKPTCADTKQWFKTQCPKSLRYLASH